MAKSGSIKFDKIAENEKLIRPLFKLRLKSGRIIILTMREDFDGKKTKEFVLSAKKKLFKASRNGELTTRREGADGRGNADRVLSAIFVSLGFLPNLSGTAYLREAVRIEVSKKKKGKSKMKDLYPLIAKEFLTTADRVERSIRNALEVAWNRSGEKNFNSVFGQSVFGRYTRPTNSEIIGLLVDKINFG